MRSFLTWPNVFCALALCLAIESALYAVMPGQMMKLLAIWARSDVSALRRRGMSGLLIALFIVLFI
jgi:uncharacterized protein YjeT (DUF2065 family)